MSLTGRDASFSHDGVIPQPSRCPVSNRKSSVTFAELPVPMEGLLRNEEPCFAREETEPSSRTPVPPSLLLKARSLPSRRSAEALTEMLATGKPSPFQHFFDTDTDEQTPEVPKAHRRPPIKSSTFSVRLCPVPAAEDCTQPMLSPFSAVNAGYLQEPSKQGHERWACQPGEGIHGSQQLQTRRASSHGGEGILGSQQLQIRRTSHGGGLFKSKVDAGKPLLPTGQAASVLLRQASSPMFSTSRQGSRRTSGSAFSSAWDSFTSTPRRLSSNGSQTAYEELSSQGYALPSSQGRSRRSWGNNKGGSSCAPSVADHVAFLARRSSFSGCESMTKSSRALVGSQKGKQSHPPVHLEMGFRPPSQGSLMDAFQALLG
uniref:Uncharacterized protein n=2 Tax=Dunaliella tertiolecta TaxID=3047 RepID=A0A7S3VIQ7_DUNTE|mmetsp:Transcript_14690/g.38946  ORF Transcript_14690/g.38946 Transcript_14690/m.38946 type:complete len:374 (-) Transcript_14690:2536-3657(-)